MVNETRSSATILRESLRNIPLLLTACLYGLATPPGFEVSEWYTKLNGAMFNAQQTLDKLTPGQ